MYSLAVMYAGLSLMSRVYLLDRQKDVMKAVQRVRQKAKKTSNLTITKEQQVDVKTVELKTIIQIVPSDPRYELESERLRCGAKFGLLAFARA